MPPEIQDLKARLLALPGPRRLVAVAGPPGAGKSTLAEALCTALREEGRSAAVVPMDGFHLDNHLLEARGSLSRKGAPQTFDAAGFVALVRRIARGEPVVYPVFDRSRDLSIAGAAELASDTEFVIFEGNYLLCDVPPWSELQTHWSFTALIDPGADVIAARLLERWLDQGLAPDAARARRDSNDLPNAEFVMANSIAPNLAIG